MVHEDHKTHTKATVAVRTEDAPDDFRIAGMECCGEPRHVIHHLRRDVLHYWESENLSTTGTMVDVMRLHRELPGEFLYLVNPYSKTILVLDGDMELLGERKLVDEEEW